MDEKFAQLMERIQKDFSKHPLTEDQSDREAVLRTSARQFAEQIARYTPASREQSLALTNLEQAVFWSGEAISRNESGPIVGGN